MAVWVVRAGRKGEQEQFALANGFAVISWRKMPCAIPADKDALRRAMTRAYSDAGSSDFNQTWNFANKIQRGDLVVVPLKNRDGRRVRRLKENGEVAVGKVVGGYEYVPDGEQGTKHRIRVEWINRRVPRAQMPADIAHRICFRWTVFLIECEEAEARIRALAQKR